MAAEQRQAFPKNQRSETKLQQRIPCQETWLTRADLTTGDLRCLSAKRAALSRSV